MKMEIYQCDLCGEAINPPHDMALLTLSVSRTDTDDDSPVYGIAAMLGQRDMFKSSTVEICLKCARELSEKLWTVKEDFKKELNR